MAMTIRERLSEIRDSAVERIGLRVVPTERLDLLEARSTEAGFLRRELDSLAWTALNYTGGRPYELKVEERRRIVQKAVVVWMKDPQAGAAVDLMNDFVFGRGLPKPKASDPEVQAVLDEFWDDADNQEVLTTPAAQVILGTDLALESNLFLQVFDDGEDGKVKFDLLDSDTVIDVVRDPLRKRRILFYVVEEGEPEEWDYSSDTRALRLRRRDAEEYQPGSVIRYYPHWRNVEELLNDVERGVRAMPKLPPESKWGDSKIFHVAINRTSKMAFGHPTMDRLLRWYNAYNTFIDARLDIITAKAAIVMRQKSEGTPNQLQKQATQALSRRGVLGMTSVDPLTGEDVQPGPRAGSIQHINDKVSIEDVSLDTGAASAEGDARMIRAQSSAATRFPPTYYGDLSSGSLATSTSLELPVLKGVEARQEVFERTLRFGCDRAIERAVDKGRLKPDLSPDEVEEATRKLVEARLRSSGALYVRPWESPAQYLERVYRLVEAHEDAVTDEVSTERDLGYEFAMPSPLKRMLTDLVGAVMNVAKTFDPNGTNIELSRILLGVALGEGLELEDPQGAVERVFPEGYQDPMTVAAQMGQMGPPDPTFGEFAPGAAGGGFPGADGQRHGAGNAYGAPMRGRPPEAMGVTEGYWPAALPPALAIEEGLLDGIEEADLTRLPPEIREALTLRRAVVGQQFDGRIADGLSGTDNGNGGSG